MWELIEEPIGKTYEGLVDVAAKNCNEFILVCREHMELGEEAYDMLKELSDFLVEIKQQKSWPGTELGGGYADVYYYKLNDITKEILKKYVKGLYSWVDPAMLNDLCFLKEGRKPWLINIAHEKESWFENITDEEVIRLKFVPGIKLKEWR